MIGTTEDQLANGKRSLDVKHCLYKVHLHLRRVKTPPAGWITAEGAGAGARRSRSLLLALHARCRALAGVRLAGTAAGAAARRPAGAQRLVLLALLRVELCTAAGAQKVTARARGEAVQATRPALTLPALQQNY